MEHRLAGDLARDGFSPQMADPGGGLRRGKTRGLLGTERLGERLPAGETKLRGGRHGLPALGAGPIKERAAFLAEARLGRIFVTAFKTFHVAIP